MSYLRFHVDEGRTTFGEALAAARSAAGRPGGASDYFAGRFLACAENGLRALPRLARFVAGDESGQLGYDPNGLRARTWQDPDTGDLYVVFMGTGPGEWPDNGVALSGQRAVNAYFTYDKQGRARDVTLREDGLSRQQAEAVDYWARVRARRRISPRGALIAAGHSKGGNKAQLLSLLFEEFTVCYSFNGQGLSPEQLALLAEEESFSARREKIVSVCGCNDFVNGLGDLVCSAANRVFLGNEGVRCIRDEHELYSMFGADGCLLPPAPRGPHSVRGENLWGHARGRRSRARVAMAVTAAGSRLLGNGTAINGEAPAARELLTGAAQAGILMLQSARPPRESERPETSERLRTAFPNELIARPEAMEEAASRLAALCSRLDSLARGIADPALARRVAQENRRVARSLELVRRLRGELVGMEEEFACVCMLAGRKKWKRKNNRRGN